jgi:sulfatase maturation enzyme AslB (radical SAM superfamily)
MTDRATYIGIGYTCNNNCIFCYEAEDDKSISRPIRTFDDIIRELESKKKDYKIVDFLGAEPTLRDDFPQIISCAKKLGYIWISFATNGRRLSDTMYAKAILEAGADNITVSMAGAEAGTHDRETQVIGSFDQTMAGIKNVLSLPRGQNALSINLILNKQNYRDLGAFMDLAIKLGIKKVRLQNTGPLSGRTCLNKKIIMDMVELGAYIWKILEEKRDQPGFPEFVLQEFIPCALPAPARRYFIGCETIENRIRIPMCHECEYRSVCGGVNKSYIDMFGASKLRI